MMNPRIQTCFFPTRHVDSYSQQLTVEDSDDTRALQAVGGSAALTFLEGCWQLLDLVPLTDVLREKRRAFTHFGKIANVFLPHRFFFVVEAIQRKESGLFTLVTSKLAWTAGLGHLPNFKTWALAVRTHSRVKEITCMVFIFTTCREQSTRHTGAFCSQTNKQGSDLKERGVWLLTCLSAAQTCPAAFYSPPAPSSLITFSSPCSVFTCEEHDTDVHRVRELAPVQIRPPHLPHVSPSHLCPSSSIRHLSPQRPSEITFWTAAD